MDEKNMELTIEELMDPMQDSEEKPSLQTDPGSIHEEGAGFPTANLEGSFPQTESENEALDGLSSENDAENIEKESFSQTEFITSIKEEPALQTTHSESQEVETEKKQPKRARRSKKETASESQSDSETDTEQETGTRTPRRRSSSRTSSVLAIDDRPGVKTEAEKNRDALLDLVESLKTRHILTGVIQGVEQPPSDPSHSFAVLYHGDFKIIIPAEEAVEPPGDFRGRPPQDVFHYLLTKRLGAEVDYIVKGIDGNAGVAAASRLEAMAAKRKEYYFGTDRDGNNLLYEGVCAEGRVVSVIRAGIFVDLFGVEVYIPLRELSYQRMLDAASAFQPGQRILVKILSIDRTDRNHIRVNASVKGAGENPYEKALRRYSVGNRYVGTVSMVDTTGVFVALDGGIDCLCSYPKRGRPPRGSRVTVRILGINHDSNRIWGAITHIAAPR